jgi:PAS domain-containing protein
VVADVLTLVYLNGGALESERFKQFLDHVSISIAVSELCPTEQFTYANLELERLTGRGAEDLQGKSWRSLPGIAMKMIPKNLAMPSPLAHDHVHRNKRQLSESALTQSDDCNSARVCHQGIIDRTSASRFPRLRVD